MGGRFSSGSFLIILRIVFTIQQAIHSHVIVNGFPIPDTVRGVGRDLEAVSSIGRFQGFPCLSSYRKAQGAQGQDAAVCPVEDEVLGYATLNPEPSVMDHPVVGL